MTSETPVDSRPPADLTLEIRKLIVAKTIPFVWIKKIHYHPFRGVWFLDFVIKNGGMFMDLPKLLLSPSFKTVYKKYERILIIRFVWEREIYTDLDHFPTIWGGGEQNFL